MERNIVPPVIWVVIHEHHRWESVPNRREPIAKNMVQWWVRQARTAAVDSFDAVIADWMVLGAQLGFRKSEWCQPSKFNKSNGLFELNIDGSNKAFTASDLKLSSSRCHQFSLSKKDPNNFTKNSSQYDQLLVLWRFQKNNDNGQQILFTRDFDNPELCVVAAAQRILERAQRLCVPAHCPVAVYTKKKKLYNITDVDVIRSIQLCARSIYNITDTSALAKFSNHSVRVGACVTLHCGGADTLTIKTRLRWRSDTFAMYLRNTPLLATKHTNIFSNTNVDQILK